MVGFKHYYTKFDHKVFSTIRGVHFMEQNHLTIGSIEPIIVEKTRHLGTAILVGYYDSPINQFPLEFLKYDTDPLLCNSVEDFVAILNSFIPFPSNRATTVKRAIFWMWIVKN